MVRLSLLCAAALWVGCAGAQGLTLKPSARLGAPEPAGTSVQTADYIVAVVNAEPITYHDVRREVQRVVMQATQMRSPLPATAEIEREVTERLITLKAQLQLARDLGVRADEAAIDEAERNIALQNQVDRAELHRRVQADGMTLAQFRDQLRDQIVLQRLREREVDARVQVSDAEVQAQWAQLQAQNDPQRLAFNLAQIVVPLDENAPPQAVSAARERALAWHSRALAGEDFAALAREAGGSGAAMGLRTLDRYPSLFAQAVRDLPPGGVSALLRSGAGFHVLKVVQRYNPDLPPAQRVQQHARHILLLLNAQRSADQARAQLAQWRAQIVAGQADFAALAQAHSQDGSAERGGDLGWADPGLFVPEFEDALAALAPGEISAPLVSRFGVHLVQLIDRREMALTQAQQTELLRNQMREKKREQALRQWLQDVRARAYVELRPAPR